MGVVPDVHRKQRTGVDATFFGAEAAGLAWIRVPGGPPVPEVIGGTATSITIRRIAPGRPTPEAAETFGRRLAVLHASGAPAFGAAPPGAPPSGWIGDLAMPYAQRATFREFWAIDRIAATAAMARDRGGLSPGQTAVVDRFVAALLDGAVEAGADEPPARLHGDLWSGNLLWASDGQVWLIDPAAHGGHRESDLAMLALFGAPHLDRILGAYDEVAPLAAGWRHRIALHQVWPLLVHAALFGGGYGSSAVGAISLARG